MVACGSQLDQYHLKGMHYHPEVFRLQIDARNAQMEYTMSQVRKVYFATQLLIAYETWRQTCNPTPQQERDLDARIVTHHRSFVYASHHVALLRLPPLIPVFDYIPTSMLGWRSYFENLVRVFRSLSLNLMKALEGMIRKSVGAFIRVAAAMESSYAAQRHEVKHITSPEQVILVRRGTTVTQPYVIEVEGTGVVIFLD